jgi:hypothetical protein
MINEPTRRKIRPADVTTDRRAQRALDPNRVAGMANDFRPAAFGVPAVSLRADGTITVLDGQHRFAALNEMGAGSKGVDCLAYEGLSLAEEAELFRWLNDSKNLTPRDLFRISVTAGDPVAVAANKALEVRGWTAEKGKKNTMSAVSTFGVLYERDARAATCAITVLAAAWGPTQPASSALALRGTWMLCKRYEHMAVDWDRMTRVLTARGQQAAQFTALARGNAAGRGISGSDGYADLLVNTYNRGKTTGKLPVWDTSKS